MQSLRIGTVAVAAALAVGTLSMPPAGANASATASRIQGTNRYGTAAALAEAAFPNGVASAVIASGAAFPDALAGAYLAGQGPSAILLTDPAALSPETASALSTLGVKKVTILGGTSAVSEAVADQLSQTVTVARIAGPTRYDTDEMVDTQADQTVGTVGAKATAIVTDGLNFPDALAAGPMAYKAHLPVILTDPNTLSPQAATTLTSLGVTQVIIMGGTSAVSAAVEQAINAMGIATLVRFAGVDRTDTAQLAATWEVANLGFSPSAVVLTRGDDFADALAGAQFAADPKVLLETADPNTLGTPSQQWLMNNAPAISMLYVLGGLSAFSAALADEALQAAGVQFSTIPAPTGLVAQGQPCTTSGCGVTLAWTDEASPAGGAPNDVASYDVLRSATSGGPYEQIADVTEGSACNTSIAVETPQGLIGSCSYEDTTVAPDVTYYYVISATPSTAPALASPYSDQVSAMSTEPQLPAPTGLTVASADCNGGCVELSWTDEGAQVVSYNVLRGAAQAGPFSQVGTVAESSCQAGLCGYEDQAVMPKTEYWYVVQAVPPPASGHADSPDSAAAFADTSSSGTQLSTPTGVQALTDCGTGCIDVSWSDGYAPTNPVTSYTVLRSTTNGGPYSSVTDVAVATCSGGGTGTCDFHDTNVANDTTYYYVVQATSTNSTYVNSADSDQVQATAETIS